MINSTYELLKALRTLNPQVDIYDDEFDDTPVIDGCSEPLSTLVLPDGFYLNRQRRTIENRYGDVYIFIYKGQI